MNLRNDFEKKWLDLLTFIGTAHPETLSESSLINWAKPEILHPRRKNRPLMLEVLQKSQQGGLSSLDESYVELSEGRVMLKQIKEYQKLKELTSSESVGFTREGLFSWIDQTTGNGKISSILQDKPEDYIQPLVNEIGKYLQSENNLYHKEASVRQRYEDESKRLKEIRDAIDSPIFSQRKETLSYIDQYTRLVLLPLDQVIGVTAETRKAMLQYHRNLIRNAIMITEGMKVEPIQLPSLSDIDEILDLIPESNDEMVFEELKFKAATMQQEQAFEDFIKTVEQNFNCQLEIDLNSNKSEVNFGNVYNLQMIQNNGAGNVKAVNSFNPENTFQ
tara:strand:- start:34 stop:1032 length:999 start_codon:yes stop_codon:yes gene_type:complete